MKINPLGQLFVEGGTQIVWEDRWHEEEIFANRLSFYILAQSFLVAAAVAATLSTDPASRWLPVALTIDLAGLLLTIVFWYALTENLRRLDVLKEIVAEGSHAIGVQGFREIGAVRKSHHEHRAQRGLPFPLSSRGGHPRRGSHTGYPASLQAHGSRSSPWRLSRPRSETRR